ncbi:alpha/beta hydrolase [Salinirubrum litoreum]|uniref:Alpha/beta hydrolase n=1 Tax=Salinirubrum litoreum TaxID=1126234 RepID=A0ABD5RGB5_9EURY|nr:dienelactone hydrolase family protein [Salinirubrum litoreum]
MSGPHQNQPVATAGTAPEDAQAGVVLVHGRGATARGMVGIAEDIGVDGVAYRAPQAARGSWYPNRFIAPIEQNEPHLASALQAVSDSVESFVDAGIPYDRIVVLGFSQGACLGSEFVARTTRRYGGVVAFSGGLIGPLGSEFDHEGDLEGTPVFLGCSDSDPHIPVERVHETRDVFERLGGEVEERIYEGMGHTINADEIGYVRELLSDLTSD